jgi:hypothetical protein
MARFFSSTNARLAARLAVVPMIAGLVLGVGAAPAEAAPAVTTQHGTLLAEVHRELSDMRATRYQHTTDVREPTGEFYYDCSGFLDYALHGSVPAALLALPVTTKTRPLAEDIVHHLQRVAAGDVAGPWSSPGSVAALRPGDVVAWLTPEGSDSNNTGHVVIVLAVPTRNAARPGEWLVKIADATASPHADDSRTAGANGLGTGTIGLVVDDKDQPVGYYWRGGVSTALKHTEIALGRAG